jgi:hypothetical protein
MKHRAEIAQIKAVALLVALQLATSQMMIFA